MPNRFSVVAALALLGSLVTTSAAQQPSGNEPAEVMVLGTYHFANPGLDVVKIEVADVLSVEKQTEIQNIIEALARFQPTKIAVEALPTSAPRLDSLYRAYRDGRHTLGRGEAQQLGFRLAERFDHPRLYPIDAVGEFPFGALLKYAEAHDPDFVAFVQAERARMAAEANRHQREMTIGEILRRKNEPEQLARDHGTYMRFSQVGAGHTYVGAELLSSWYERNIRIFSNLQYTADPGDRILVIFGSGHAPILRELISYAPTMSLVEARGYLPPQ